MDKKRIAIIAIIVGVFIFLLKLAAYFTSNSVALLSDALESIINIVASVMMFAALSIASRAKDEGHKYGHQKAENISALIEGVLIIVAAVLIFQASIGRIFNPILGFEDINLGIIISLCATALNGILAVTMMREAKKNRSMALEGDAKHLFSDVMSSVGVVIGLFIANLTGILILDPLIAMVVAVLLVKMGIDVFKRTSQDLMDSTCVNEEKEIVAVLDRLGGFLEYHDLKTRRSGHLLFMEVHICMNGEISLTESHNLSVMIEKELESAIPGIETSIHIEDHDWCQKARAKEKEKS